MGISTVISRSSMTMRILSLIVFSILITAFAGQAQAGMQLVCKGRSVQSQHKVVQVDCSNRKDFVDTLGAAWRTLRKNSIGGSVENLCWEAYNQAREMHPSISFANISDGFLARCNMGLAYVQ